MFMSSSHSITNTSRALPVMVEANSSLPQLENTYEENTLLIAVIVAASIIACATVLYSKDKDIAVESAESVTVLCHDGTS